MSETVFIIAWVISLATGVLALFLYGVYLRNHLAIAAVATDKARLTASTKGFAWLDAKFVGWKTIALAWIAALTQGFSYITTDVLTGWQALPWAQVFDAKIANWITIACALLIPLTHVAGLSKAATTVPVPVQTPPAPASDS